MALQSCPEVGKMDRMSYAQVKGCGCLERDMTWGRQSLKAAFPAAGNRPCTEGHLGGPHGVHPRSTMLASPENLCSSQLPTTHRTRQGTLDPPRASLSVHLLSVLLAACPASPPLPYVSALTWMTEMYSYQASPLLPFPLQNPCFCSSPSCPRQKSTQGALPLRALPWPLQPQATPRRPTRLPRPSTWPERGSGPFSGCAPPNPRELWARSCLRPICLDTHSGLCVPLSHAPESPQSTPQLTLQLAALLSPQVQAAFLTFLGPLRSPTSAICTRGSRGARDVCLSPTRRWAHRGRPHVHCTPVRRTSITTGYSAHRGPVTCPLSHVWPKSWRGDKRKGSKACTWGPELDQPQERKALGGGWRVALENRPDYSLSRPQAGVVRAPPRVQGDQGNGSPGEAQRQCPRCGGHCFLSDDIRVSTPCRAFPQRSLRAHLPPIPEKCCQPTAQEKCPSFLELIPCPVHSVGIIVLVFQDR